MSRKLVVTFGRFNPPTIGHYKLLNKVKEVANGGEYAIFASHTNDARKNPLTYDCKINFMKEMFPDHAENIKKSNAKSLFEVLQNINDQYDDIVIVAGSDRVSEFRERLNKYNGSHLYQMDSIDVVSAGNRDPDSDGIQGISASKMRQAVKDNDLKIFLNGLPHNYDGRKLFFTLRDCMGFTHNKGT